ncbi:MAG: hypothetical protein BJ554DRAFT_8439 [Olpidium bornovanus]|uniref:Uncharacterized protein n=1 Tax=Olpidium bornovanus TaxID=278681 RepID=A0A8H7ZU04_9FUNG|nr:MAG: hypothetical protein BJ554DRAFT_8439 [Olpidium bornovanus]
MDGYFHNAYHQEVLYVATFLDPRFGPSFFKMNEWEDATHFQGKPACEVTDLVIRMADKFHVDSEPPCEKHAVRFTTVLEDVPPVRAAPPTADHMG